jgi:hypothetical protein
MVSLMRSDRARFDVLFRAGVLCVIGAGALDCVWKTGLPSDVTSIKVAPDRELVVTDETLLSGPLAMNTTSAPLSFRHAVQDLPIAGGAVLGWLRAWSARLTDEGHPDRAQILDQRVTCRWLQAISANQCDAFCSACTASVLALDQAPFRLIAVANRTDLAVMPDRAGGGGEGRLVFAITDGPADDPGSPSLQGTVIFEYAQMGSAFDWATRWHALGAAPSDEDFATQLVALTEVFVQAGSLAQIRTADAWTGPMILNQFDIESEQLVATKVRNSPDWRLVSAAAFDAFVQTNARAIHEGTAVLPSAWWATASSPTDTLPPFAAALAEHDDLTRATCGGCHALSATGFQIDPIAKGAAKLSRFLVDPSKDEDELRRRVEWMQLELSGHGI